MEVKMNVVVFSIVIFQYGQGMMNKFKFFDIVRMLNTQKENFQNCEKSLYNYYF